MSTIAVFMAIGGSAVAVSQISGSQLKDRSVAGKKLKGQTIGGGKLKNGAVTGKQVKESTLGRVPSAKSADTASSADAANTATTATTAITANDSLALGGLPPSAYQRCCTSTAGSAPLDSTTPQRVLSSSAPRFDLATTGGRGSAPGLAVANRGADELVVTTVPSTGAARTATIAAGGSAPLRAARSSALDAVVRDAADPARSAWVHCLLTGAGAPTAFCWRIESSR
jgi:hypothetical protein